ncbi:MAG: exosortase/archaeosortase family protein [Dehalococcoidia bacterium]|nr:exosortase/archaeosortase family protein [Dehalococcoidia bacterium]
MRRAYWIIGTAVFLGIALYLLYLPTLEWLWGEWFGTGNRFYAHGSLVLLISVFLVFRKRPVFASASPWLEGSPVVLFGLVLGTLALLQHLTWLSAYSLLLLAIGVFLVVCGKEVTRQLLFPILFLTLAIPFPFTEQIAGLMAQVVAAGSVALAEAVGLRLTANATWIVVGGNAYSIDPLCSSLNIMLALYTLVLPVLYLTHRSWARCALFLGAVPAVAVVFKILLVVSVFGIAQNGTPEEAMGAYHGWAGILGYWVSLLSVMLPLLLSRSRWQRTSPEPAR